MKVVEETGRVSTVLSTKVDRTSRDLHRMWWMFVREADLALALDSPSETVVRQLRGLAMQEDHDAFSPLNTDELSPNVPRRQLGLRGLADSATERLIGSGPDTRPPLSFMPRASGCGRYLRIGWAVVSWFGLDYERWTMLRDTPLWLEVMGGRSARSPIGGVRLRLDALRQRVSAALFRHGAKLQLPVGLPVGPRWTRCLPRWLGNWRRSHDGSVPHR